MNTMEGVYDVAIIGGGLAGLTAANLLARQGKRVVLFEKTHAVGGRAQTKETKGFHLNLGPHALYRSGAGISVLREVGVEPRGALPSTSGAYAIKGGKKYTFPAGVVSLLTTGLFDLSAKLEVGRLLGSIGKIDCDRLMDVTASEWVETNLSHPDVRDLVYALFRVATYVNAPQVMSARVAIRQLQMALSKSVLYIDGGWQSLVDALDASAVRMGVAMETESKAAIVERDGAGAVRAVRLEGGRAYAASNVVIAASPAVAAGIVEDAERSSLHGYAERSIPVKLAGLDVCLSRLPDPRATFALGIDQSLYLSVHSAFARLAPEGAAMIHVARYLSPDQEDPSAGTERELEDALDLVQPGWRDHLIYRRFMASITVMNALPSARDGGTIGRPGPEVQGVPGLFVAGDWVGPEGLLADASLASAKRVAELIIRRTAPRAEVATGTLW